MSADELATPRTRAARQQSAARDSEMHRSDFYDSNLEKIEQACGIMPSGRFIRFLFIVVTLYVPIFTCSM